MNSTLEKFGYATGLLHESEHWVILLRPQQVTLGSLILGAKSQAHAYSALSAEAFAEMHTQVRRIESALQRAFDYEKINYLMLMMVDPHVHYHVIPRYSSIRIFADIECQDAAWPGPPRLDIANEFTSVHFQQLLQHLKPFFAD